MFFRIQFVVLFIAVSFATGSPCDAQQAIEVRGRTMGPIPFKVLVVTDHSEPEKLKAIQSAVNDSLQRVNTLMSTYIEDSDISKFNRSNSDQWQSVDADTVAVVARSLEICEMTEGAFDPTVGPLVSAWNFGAGKAEVPELPSDTEVEKLITFVGYKNIEVREEPPAIRKLNPNVQLDLSAIAKGYAVDRVGQSLEKLGYQDFMVEVGGEVTTRGERAAGGPWNVAVEKPNSSTQLRDSERAHRVVQLSGNAIATSGDYRNFIDIEGKRYSHTINPKNGRPVEHNLAIASVMADDCMTADALATAVMVMGHDKGSKLCEKLGFPLLAVARSDSADGLPHITHVSMDFPIRENDAEASAVTEEPEQTQAAEPETAASSRSEILPVFLATFVVFCLMILGMAVGAIFNNKPVTGSCGGIANMTNEDGDQVCGICSKPTIDCEDPQASASAT